MSEYFRQLVQEYEALALDPSVGAQEALVAGLENKYPGTYEKHIVPILASSALMYKGVPGIEALADVLPRAPS